MNYILKCVLFLSITFGNVLWAAEDSVALQNLEIALHKLQDQIVGAKLIVNGKKVAHNDAVAANNTEEIETTRVSVEETESHLTRLQQELYRIQSRISDLASKNADSGIKTESSNTGTSVNNISSSKILLPGWNTFSIPVNKSILSSNSILGEYSSIWGYDSLTNQWIKNPTTLLPGKGYFIRTVNNGYKLSFQGASFSTQLDTVVKKSRNWYFLGASDEVNNIDYTKYVILKYELQRYIKNPPSIQTGDAFWAYRR